MLRPTVVSIFLLQDLWQTDGTLDELVVAESINKTSGKEVYIDLIIVHEKFISTENKIIKLDVHMNMYHSLGKLGDVVVVIIW